MAKRNTVTSYFIWLGLATLLLWLSLRMLPPGAGQSRWAYLMHTWQQASKGWLWLMALLAMVSHLIRAERWRMMLAAAGRPVRLYHAFLSLMVGYLVNLVIPRGGEVSRCLNLYKLNRCEVSRSFATVVAERALDLLCFAVVVILAFALESHRLVAFMQSLPVQLPSLPGADIWIVAAVAGLALTAMVFLILKRFPVARTALRNFFQGFAEGLRASLKVRQPALFVFYTVAIWALYFFMSYSVLMAFEETRLLDYRAVLSTFAIGSLAMVLPLPGGTGSYHTLVPAGLSVLYDIPLPHAVAFTFIFHAWQTVIMIAGGMLSLIATGWSHSRTKAESERS